MILVDARVTIVHERQDDFTREVQKILNTVRKEAGCRRYELFFEVHQPGIFHFIEEWESQDHLDRHIEAPHMQEYFAKTAPWQAAPILLTRYEIGSKQSSTLG